jgi:hypothetical protein
MPIDTRRRGRTLLAIAAALALSPLARADGDGHRAQRVPTLPAYAQECGACHLAYPPGLLPAPSWQRLMVNLPRHFGTDASLDAAARQSIDNWLAANAGTARKVSRDPTPPPEDRISRAPWFQREHREVASAAWSRPAIKSASNCSACHPRADQGDFSERDIRIPR